MAGMGNAKKSRLRLEGEKSYVKEGKSKAVDHAGCSTDTGFKIMGGPQLVITVPTKALIHDCYDFFVFALFTEDEKTLRTYWRNYFEKTDALIWVVDSADRGRILDCRQELAGLLLEEVHLMMIPARASLTTIQRLMGASLLVLANKSDIEGSMSVEEIRKSLALDAIKTHNWTIKQCSATTGLNVQEGIQWVVEDARKRLFLY
ncbi:MAG: hypothetical protein Q9203_001054 [Teloschistes exilis]